MTQRNWETFRELAHGVDLVPVGRRIFSDQLTPVLAYRRLVTADDRVAPSFLLESVEGGQTQGRYSFVGAQPAVEITATGHEVTIEDHRAGLRRQETCSDPLDRVRGYLAGCRAARFDNGPDAFCGGWVGYAGYDTVRWVESGKLTNESAPTDDRLLPDMHFGLYDRVLVFDHVRKMVHVVVWADTRGPDDLRTVYEQASAELDHLVERVQRPSVNLPAGAIDLRLRQHGDALNESNMTRPQFESAVHTAREYIHAGDIFQVVLSQRFSRSTTADPFDIYRALRIVNPSPYMIYLQTRGSILVASSPEILCRVTHEGGDGQRDAKTQALGDAGEELDALQRTPSPPAPLPVGERRKANAPHDSLEDSLIEGVKQDETRQIVVNRPLAGTRRRGATAEEDAALERELLADEKERAEHIMLVDLGRNDVGRVAAPGQVSLDRIMEIERYSHVMHISSTVTGELDAGLTSWDALRAALPVGTVSGAPKIRAMQIIDELEPTRRGPYGGGIGVVSFDDQMDIALALRTMVIPVEEKTVESQRHRGTEKRRAEEEELDSEEAKISVPGLEDGEETGEKRIWTIHIQAGAGIVADSVPAREYEETQSKAAALARAIDLAEAAFDTGHADG